MGKLTRDTPLSVIFIHRLTLRKYIGLFLAGLMIISCAGYSVRGDRPRGVYHRVKSGETLLMIARAYQVNLRELAEINRIDNPNRIEADTVIFIPDAQLALEDIGATALPMPPPVPLPTAPAPPVTQPPPPRMEKEPAPLPRAVVRKPETPNREAPVLPRKRLEAPPAEATVKGPEPSGAVERDPPPRRLPAKSEKEEATRIVQKPPAKVDTVDIPVPKPEKTEAAEPSGRTIENDAKADQIQFDKKRFVWPVRGKLISRFGIQPNRINNNGIWIAAPDGSVVVAAADGIVDRSMYLKGYGETIIIQHEAQYATVYAHLGDRAVQSGTRVKKGDRIAFLGKAEPPEEPYLHFEIRQKNKARNPLFFLP